MRLLLDTHVVLWALGDSRRLGRDVRNALIDGRVEIAVSAATIWEIAIKAGLGKLRIPGTVAGWLVPAVDELGARRLDVTAADAAAVQNLPMHHRDPFDRLLIAQAVAGGFTIATTDDAFAAYGVPLLRT